MKPTCLTLLIYVLLPVQAFAHVGHVGEFAAHDHWVAGAAIAAAAAITIWGALKGKAIQNDDAEPAQEAKETA